MSELSPKWDTLPENHAKGLVQIFTGDGKGKTSAALGTVIRSLGHNRKVYVGFFMKGDYPYGERNILNGLPNVDFASFGGLEFVYPDKIKPEDIEQARLAFDDVRKAVISDKYDLVVLDEVCVAVDVKLIPLADLIRLVKEKPPRLELILTGRGAAPELIEIADLVTECRKIKHPYDNGVESRKGIEY